MTEPPTFNASAHSQNVNAKYKLKFSQASKILPKILPGRQEFH